MLMLLAIVLFLNADALSEGIGPSSELPRQVVIGNKCIPHSPYHAQKPENLPKTGVAIYVLGGAQKSLKLKFCTAADLYQKGGYKLMFADSKGLTEYDRHLDRNLTNNEWTVRQLAGLGVKDEDISFIKLQNGFFGTLREAKSLKTICIERRIQKLLLVCSAYHRKRVQSTFSMIFENSGVDIDIHTVDEHIGLMGLIIEHVKLIFYDTVLIPLTRNSS